MTTEDIAARMDKLRLRFSELQESKANIERQLEETNVELFRLQGENRLLTNMLQEIDEAVRAKREAIEPEMVDGRPQVDATPSVIEPKGKKDKTMEDYS